MSNSSNQTGLKPLEARTLHVGFILAGLVIAVTGVSYLLNMKFQPQFLVWIIGVAFIAVALFYLSGCEPLGVLQAMCRRASCVCFFSWPCRFLTS